MPNDRNDSRELLHSRRRLSLLREAGILPGSPCHCQAEAPVFPQRAAMVYARLRTERLMSGVGWWDSFERMDAVFRVSRNSVIAGFTIAAVSLILGFTAVAVLSIILATTACLFTIFAWFRRDDLARGSHPRP
jgi:hypothetical protein